MGISILCLSLSRHHPKNLIQDRFIRERESSNHRGGRERENVRRSSSATDFSASYLPAHIFPGRFFYTFFPGQKKNGTHFFQCRKIRLKFTMDTLCRESIRTLFTSTTFLICKHQWCILFYSRYNA